MVRGTKNIGEARTKDDGHGRILVARAVGGDDR
jgi:hypothetical protein